MNKKIKISVIIILTISLVTVLIFCYQNNYEINTNQIANNTDESIEDIRIWALNNGYITEEVNIFKPATRLEIVDILYKARQESLYYVKNNNFVDVNADSVDWAYYTGITKGLTDQTIH